MPNVTKPKQTAATPKAPAKPTPSKPSQTSTTKPQPPANTGSSATDKISVTNEAKTSQSGPDGNKGASGSQEPQSERVSDIKKGLEDFLVVEAPDAGRAASEEGSSVSEPTKLGEGEIAVKKDGRILKPEAQPGDEGRPSVIVADNFETPFQDVNGDGERDVSHGSLSANALYNDGFNVTGYQMGGEGSFDELEKDLGAGKLGPKGTPIQMSFGQDFDMKQLGEQLGLDINEKSIEKLAPEIQKRMRAQAEGTDDSVFKSYSRDDIEHEVRVMDFVDSAQEMGHPVVPAGSNEKGNFSPGYLKADKLATGVDEANKPIGLPGERHGLTTDAPGVFKPKEVFGEDGSFKGISTNGDNKKPEVTPSMLTGTSEKASPDKVQGNSFSPPFLIRWAEQTGEYFSDIPSLKTFPERDGVPVFDKAS